MATKSKKVLAKSSKVEKKTNAAGALDAGAYAEARRATVDAVVQAFAELYKTKARKTPYSFSPNERISLTLDGLWLLLAAVRDETNARFRWDAMAAVKRMIPGTCVVRGDVLPLYDFLKYFNPMRNDCQSWCSCAE